MLPDNCNVVAWEPVINIAAADLTSCSGMLGVYRRDAFSRVDGAQPAARYIQRLHFVLSTLVYVVSMLHIKVLPEGIHVRYILWFTQR
jgi:hypothetical protein